MKILIFCLSILMFSTTLYSNEYNSLCLSTLQKEPEFNVLQNILQILESNPDLINKIDHKQRTLLYSILEIIFKRMNNDFEINENHLKTIRNSFINTINNPNNNSRNFQILLSQIIGKINEEKLNKEIHISRNDSRKRFQKILLTVVYQAIKNFNKTKKNIKTKHKNSLVRIIISEDHLLHEDNHFLNDLFRYGTTIELIYKKSFKRKIEENYTIFKRSINKVFDILIDVTFYKGKEKLYSPIMLSRNHH